MKKYLFIILTILSCVKLAYCADYPDKLKNYGIGDLINVKMSYRHDGAESKFQIQICGGGKATYSFQHFNQPEQAREVHLEESLIVDFIKQYANLNFYDYDFKGITDSSSGEHVIYDAGTTTFSYQYKDTVRSIDYEIIKTKTKGRMAVPINEQAKKLVQLQNMYWSIINLEIYLDKLKDYRKMDKGVLANDLSSIESLVKKKSILSASELVPIIMEIISQKEFRDSIGQYAASALEAIAGEKLPGDWWDCNKWLAWWQKNKDSYGKN